MGLISRVSSRTYRHNPPTMSKSDKIRKRNNNSKTKTLNPFEQKSNKTKFKVLNRREKSNKGTPGLTRKKAEEYRKQTIGLDLKNFNKTNKFYDHRISNKDGDFESTGVKRFASLKKKVKNAKFTNKNSKFSLQSSSEGESNSDSDDDILTHNSKPLSNIKEHFITSNDDEITSQRKMQQLNFGGGAKGPEEFLKYKQSREEAKNE